MGKRLYQRGEDGRGAVMLMEYKGRRARVAWSEEDKCYVGHVLDAADIISFDGRTLDEAERMFREIVEEVMEGGNEE